MSKSTTANTFDRTQVTRHGPVTEEGHERNVSNHLKWLANELPVTFIYTGVGLAERRFFAEGLTGENAALTQTARRWTRLDPPPFEITSPADVSPGDPAGGQCQDVVVSMSTQRKSPHRGDRTGPSPW